jgi:hypothetical protein
MNNMNNERNIRRRINYNLHIPLNTNNRYNNVSFIPSTNLLTQILNYNSDTPNFQYYIYNIPLNTNVNTKIQM